MGWLPLTRSPPIPDTDIDSHLLEQTMSNHLSTPTSAPARTTPAPRTGRGEPDEIVCMRRVIEYTGTRSWVEETLKKSVTGAAGFFKTAFGTIREVALLEFTVKRDEDGDETTKEARRGKKTR